MYYFIVQNTQGDNLCVCKSADEALEYMAVGGLTLNGYRIEVMKRFD